MLKKIALTAAVIFVFGLFSVILVECSYAKECKIGYIDLTRIVDNYNKTKDAEKALEEKSKLKEAEMKKLDDEIKKLKDEQALLSEKAKAEKQTVIDNKIKALQEFVRKSRDELIKERNDRFGAVLKDVEKVVTDYSKETGYDIILNSRVLLYGNEQLDLTEDVLKRLNK